MVSEKVQNNSVFRYGPYQVTPSENGECLRIQASVPNIAMTVCVFGVLFAAEFSLWAFLRWPVFPPLVRNIASLVPLVFALFHSAQILISFVYASTIHTIDRADGTFSQFGVTLSPLSEIAVVRWVQVFDWRGRGKTWVVALEKGGPTRYAHGRQFILWPPLWAAPQEDEAKDLAKNLALYLGVSAAASRPPDGEKKDKV